MSRRRHTPDQIIRKLAEGQKLLASGTELDAVCRHLEIAESTWHRWIAQYGGMKANDAKRLKELEIENSRLKRLLADAELDKAMLKELAAEGTSSRTVSNSAKFACAMNGSRASTNRSSRPTTGPLRDGRTFEVGDGVAMCSPDGCAVACAGGS